MSFKLSYKHEILVFSSDHASFTLKMADIRFLRESLDGLPRVDPMHKG
jgi:hypothetical protein